jgi:hypothetical protein
MSTFAIHLDFAAALVADADRSRRVAAILMRPCFAGLERLYAHRGDRWVSQTDRSETRIVEVLLDRSNKAASFETKRNREMNASAEIQNGTQDREETPTRFYAELCFPVSPSEVEATVMAVGELAAVLDSSAGFIAVEPSYELAHKLAVGGSKPLMREQLSRQRAIARRGRDWHYKELATKVSGLEWGTFLGAGHLAQIDLDAVRISGAFERVVSVTPSLAFLQLTAEPRDDLSGEVELRLPRALEAVRPLLMNLSDVNLD